MDIGVLLIVMVLILAPTLLITYLFKPSMPIFLGSISIIITIVVNEGFVPYEMLIIPGLLIAISLWSVFSGGMASE